MAGKTGTAQVVKMGARRLKAEQVSYFERDHAWFAAFAPADDPEIVVVVLNEHSGFGSTNAAPTATAVVKQLARAPGAGRGGARRAGRAQPPPARGAAARPRRRRPGCAAVAARAGAAEARGAARRGQAGSEPWRLTSRSRRRRSGGCSRTSRWPPRRSSSLAISAIGIWNLASASRSAHAPVWISQTAWMGVGVFVALAVTLFDHRTFHRLAWVFYAIVVVLLVLVLREGPLRHGRAALAHASGR